MKKVFILLVMVFGLFVNPFTSLAVPLFEESFEDGIANGIAGLYSPSGWGVTTEGSNEFYRSPVGSGNSPIYISQKFPNGVNLEFMSRHEAIGDRWDVTFLGTGWGMYLWGDTRFHPGKIGWSTSNNYWGYLGNSPIEPDKWYEYDITIIGNIVTLYINDIYFNKFDIGPTGIDLNNFQIWFGTWGQRGLDNIQVTAVPEPATMLLLGSGLIGLAGYGRKKFLKK